METENSPARPFDAQEALTRLRALDHEERQLADRIAAIEATRGQVRNLIRELETEITDQALATHEAEQVSFGDGAVYRTRYTPGRAAVTWDAEAVEKHLPAELKPAVLTYTPKVNRSVLGALEMSGQLSPELIEAAKTVTPPNPRFVIERTPAQ